MTPKTKVSQLIAFCNAQVTGHFRYKDLFQILPMPDDAPKSIPFLPSSYPFILEVSYQSCPNQFIESARQREKAVIYTRLLNLFSNQGISPSPLVAQDGWVIKTEDLSNITSEWKQLGYAYAGLKGSMNNFSTVENINPLEKTSFLTYYFEPLTKPHIPLTLPETLELTLDKAFALDKSTWKKFFMACSWYAQYQKTWAVSHSSAFIALVTAIECLAQEKEECDVCKQPILENDEDICSSCGQPRYRVTKHFRDFLKAYFPLFDSFPREIKMLYQVRSQLAHGGDLLQADLEPWKFFLDVKKHEQYHLQRILSYIVGITIFVWLLKVPFKKES